MLLLSEATKNTSSVSDIQGAEQYLVAYSGISTVVQLNLGESNCIPGKISTGLVPLSFSQADNINENKINSSAGIYLFLCIKYFIKRFFFHF